MLKAQGESNTPLMSIKARPAVRGTLSDREESATSVQGLLSFVYCFKAWSLDPAIICQPLLCVSPPTPVQWAWG